MLNHKKFITLQFLFVKLMFWQPNNQRWWYSKHQPTTPLSTNSQTVNFYLF